MSKVRNVLVLLLAVSLVISGSVTARDYSGAIASLVDMDSTLAVIKKQLQAQGRAPKLLASADGDVAAGEADMFYSVVNNLEIVSQELQGVLNDAQKESAAQPKHPAGMGYGTLTFTGFLHQQYQREFDDEESSTFVSKRVRLGLTGKLNSYAHMKFVGEFANSPKLMLAIIKLMPNKYWSVQFGQQKPPYGAEFLTPGPKLPFVNFHMAKGLGTSFDIGASVTYKNALSKDAKMNLTVGAFNGSGMNTSDANSEKNYIGRAVFSFANSFTVAPNFIIGKTNDVGAAIEDIHTYGGSVNWSWMNEEIQAEYHHSKVGGTEKTGWYAWAAHSIHTHARFLPVVQLLARYEQYDADVDLSGDRKDRITIGTNLFVDGKYTKLQLNYEFNGEETVSVDNDEFLVNLQVAF